MQKIKIYIFQINGIHCSACVTLTKNELIKIEEVLNVKVSLKNFNVQIMGDFSARGGSNFGGGDTPEAVAEYLSLVLKPYGYSLSLEKKEKKINWSDFKIAIPVSLFFIIFFILLQKLGIVNLINVSEVSYGTAFIIGLIASVSTCMAVVGGLVLSMSANFAKEGNKTQPQILFHISRLISFFVLGGAIGALGSTFQLNITATFILGIIVAMVLIVLGINLLDIFPWAKKLQPTIPNFIGKHIHKLKNINHIFTPLLIGVATFFLPCGFTQFMQIYTLTTGNFLTGALIMFSFALGTLPVLSFLSFSSLTIHKKAQSGIFFKTAGIIVIFFGIFNLINSFVAIGIISPVFNF